MYIRTLATIAEITTITHIHMYILSFFIHIYINTTCKCSKKKIKNEYEGPLLNYYSHDIIERKYSYTHSLFLSLSGNLALFNKCPCNIIYCYCCCWIYSTSWICLCVFLKRITRLGLTSSLNENSLPYCIHTYTQSNLKYAYHQEKRERVRGRETIIQIYMKT